MHYLIHGPAAYAIVEDAAQAQKHVDAGWQRSTLDVVRKRWRKRDAATFAALGVTQPQTETAPLQGREGTIITRLASGWTMYDARKGIG